MVMCLVSLKWALPFLSYCFWLNIYVNETSSSKQYVSLMMIGYSRDIFWTISKAVCVYAACVRISSYGICVCGSSWHPTEGPCGMAGHWHPLSRASRGGRMCLGLPTAQTHCWCLQAAEQNKGETRRHGERERGWDFAHRESEMSGASRG